MSKFSHYYFFKSSCIGDLKQNQKVTDVISKPACHLCILYISTFFFCFIIDPQSCTLASFNTGNTNLQSFQGARIVHPSSPPNFLLNRISIWWGSTPLSRNLSVTGLLCPTKGHFGQGVIPLPFARNDSEMVF